MASTVEISLPLPVLPEGWAGEKDFKSVGQLSAATDRNIEPVGPHFLAYARRVRALMIDSTAFTNSVCVEAP
jgi:DnaJ family protein C protein 2